MGYKILIKKIDMLMFDCRSIEYGWLILEIMYFLKKLFLKVNIIKYFENLLLMKYYKYLLNKNIYNL